VPDPAEGNLLIRWYQHSSDLEMYHAAFIFGKSGGYALHVLWKSTLTQAHKKLHLTGSSYNILVIPDRFYLRIISLKACTVHQHECSDITNSSQIQHAKLHVYLCIIITILSYKPKAYNLTVVHFLDHGLIIHCTPPTAFNPQRKQNDFLHANPASPHLRNVPPGVLTTIAGPSACLYFIGVRRPGKGELDP